MIIKIIFKLGENKVTIWPPYKEPIDADFDHLGNQN